MKWFSLIFVFAVCTQLTYAQGKEVKYQDGSATLKGYFVKAQGTKGKAPGIVIIHAWMGLDDHARHSAEKLGKLGYNAFAADIYGENSRPKDRQEAAQLSSYYKNNPSVYQTRIKAAIQELIQLGTDPDKIVVMGYCFGGTGALEAARGDLPVAGVVSFHGGLGKDTSRTNGLIKPKVLVLHGADDPFVSEAEIQSLYKEMREGKADWQMVYYGDAVHAFTETRAGNDKSKGAAYNEKADERSWQALLTFLKEVY
jgi:dienelactone hydrolase